MKLDIACGKFKQEGFKGIDIRPLPGVDYVWDLEQFPWPIESNSVVVAIASHYIEHIKPWNTFNFMNEVWRIVIPGGTFCASTPYPGSRLYWQDPTHSCGWNEVSFQYFDPEFHLYSIYTPKPWKIKKGFPVWQANGNLEVIMEKMEEVENG